MRRIGIAAAVAAALALAGTAEAEQELRIGFINTLSGPSAVLGEAQKNGFMLGLEREGWKKDGDKLGGVPMTLVVADDQFKPDVAAQTAQRLLKSDRVHVVAGVFWSNILAAVMRPVVEAERIMLTTNAGSSQSAGAGCSRYFTSSSFSNDQFSEALGQLMTDDEVKTAYILAPNYQGGKDMIAGFKRFYKGGEIVGESLFKLNQADFQTYIAEVRAKKPEAVFVFAPGGMGISFLRQWAASGAGEHTKVYSVGTVDWLTLPPVGKAAVGTYHTNPYDPNATHAANQEFVEAYKAKHDAMPDFYQADAYDAARLIAAAVRAVGGKVDDSLALAKALRHTEFPSVRGDISFNVNGVPIQKWYKREVVIGADGKPTIATTGVVFDNQKDSYWQQCPEAERL